MNCIIREVYNFWSCLLWQIYASLLAVKIACIYLVTVGNSNNLVLCQSSELIYLPLGRQHPEVVMGTPSSATIMILDDDHAGIFHFEGEKQYQYQDLIFNIPLSILDIYFNPRC